MNKPRIINSLKAHEGFRGHPYDCGTGSPVRATVGATTIGYGRNLDANPLEDDEAEFLLKRDIHRAWRSAVGIIREFASLSERRQEVVVEMIFWVGAHGFKKFRKMRKAIDLCDFSTAADELLDSKLGREHPRRTEELAGWMREG